MATSRTLNGENNIVSISSRAASRANPSATQESDSRKMIRDGSGPTLRERLAFYDHATLSWRTFQACLDGEWEVFNRAWPVSGIVVSGVLYLPRKLERITSVEESGLWPTLSASDKKGSHGGGQTSSLRTAMHDYKKYGRVPPRIAQWPTLTATDKHDINPRKAARIAREALTSEVPRAAHALALQVAVRLWPTLIATDARRPKTGGPRRRRDGSVVNNLVREVAKESGAKVAPKWLKESPVDDPQLNFLPATEEEMRQQLEAAAQQREELPTPQARDKKDRGTPQAIARAGERSQVTLPRRVAMDATEKDSEVTGSLNPRWAAWLMGYPVDWLD